MLLVRPPNLAGALSGRRALALTGLWTAVSVIAVALVAYGLGPLLEQRDQRSLMSSYRADIDRAANEKGTLYGPTVPVKAPELGDPVGIIEIGSIHLQDVVVEGVAPSQTQKGPGHVPGTAGLGQAGNSAVLGRIAGYGGPFADLDKVHTGDPVLVTTTHGFIVYKVTEVRAQTILGPGQAPPPSSTTGDAATGAATTTETPEATIAPVPGAEAAGSSVPSATPTTAAATPPGSAAPGTAPTAAGSPGTVALQPPPPPPASISVDELLGKSKDDQLTLITAHHASPSNGANATVVIAKMDGLPYKATPQGGRTDAGNGLGGESGAWSALALAVLGYGTLLLIAAYLYRNSSSLAAHLLTTVPLLVFTLLVAEAAIRLFPPWL
jgi:sortase (surface protein transpeptidase)